MARRGAALERFMFERSFDDPRKLYLPGEKKKSELAAEAEAEAAARAEAEAKAKARRKAEEAAAAPPPPEKKYTQADLDAAKEQGYIDGHTAALEEAETSREHYIADAMTMIGTNLAALQDQQAAANRQLGETAMRMVFALAGKLLPAHARAHAVDNVGTFVKAVLPLVTGEPRLVIRTHSMIVEDVERRLEEVVAKSSFHGSVTVSADYELQPGDCRIEWEGGGADRDEARIWRDIREAMAGNFGDVDAEALDAAADVLARAAEADTGADTEDAAEAPAEAAADSGGMDDNVNQQD